MYATTRSEQRAADLSLQGIHPIQVDILDPASLGKLPRADVILFAVGFDRCGPSTIRQVYVDGLSSVLEAASDTVKRFIYISTTGVYAQSDGEWVDEDSPCQPTSDGAQAHLEAERRLRQHALGERAVILRLAGIYGPGRVPRDPAVIAANANHAPGGYLNLIHVDDAVQTVVAAAHCDRVPRTYVVADGHPVLREDYYRCLAGLQTPAQGVNHSPNLRERSPKKTRGRSNKRVNNRRMLRELGVSLRFPDFRDGLVDALGR